MDFPPSRCATVLQMEMKRKLSMWCPVYRRLKLVSAVKCSEFQWNLSNYSTYLEMLGTFRVKSR
jgi:hypothetical protein